MKVLMITGDRNLLKDGTEGAKRLSLQRSAVSQLDVVYWGVGSLFPRVRDRYEVVTVQDPFLRGVFAWFVARRYGAKLNVQVHTDLSVASFGRRLLAKIVLKSADSIRVVSHKLKAQVEAMGVRGKIVVLPVFVDLEKYHSLIRKPHEGKNILWIGRYEEEKNPLAAIEILKSVRKEIPNVRLKMIGSGSMKEILLKASTDLPVDEIDAGWQDPAPFFEVADVVLCTSPQESWGASIVEALAAGIPVVAPDVGIAREAGARVVERKFLAQEVVKVLTHGEAGRLALTILPKEEWAVQWRSSLV